MNIIKSYIVTNAAAAGGGSGSVTSFSSGNLSPLFTTSVATATTTPALSFTAVNQNANLVYAGPATGPAAAPTFRALVAADIPALPYATVNGHVIENSGTPLTQRANLNFTNGLTSSDNTPDTDVRLGGTTTNLSLSGTVTAIGLEVIPSGNFQVYTSGGSPVISLGISNTGVEPGIVMGGDPTPANSFLSLRSAWLDDFGDSWRFDFKKVSAIWTRGSINSALPVYAADYSANYTDRTWVDRGYVLGAKTYAGTQTFLSSGLELNNPASTFQYIFTGAAIVADRTITMPLLTGNDVLVTEAFTQTLTNKTISGASNTITNVSLTTGVTGILPPANGGTGIANNAASTITISGNFDTTFTVTASTNVTLPTSGTLVNSTQAWLAASGVTLTGTNTITQAGFNTSFSGDGRVTFSPTADRAGLNVGQLASVNPTNLTNGDMWYNSTANIFSVRKGGSTQNVVTSGGADVTSRVTFWNSANTVSSSANFTFVTNRILGTTLYLTLSAGTATAGTCPLVMTSGTNLTVAISGGIEYNNTFHMTNSDATRRHVVLAPNTTKVTAGAPYANDGYLVMNVGGTDFKMMTTA